MVDKDDSTDQYFIKTGFGSACHYFTIICNSHRLPLLFRFGTQHADLEEIRPAPGIRDRIRTGAGEMFSLIRPDGSVFFGDFPKTGETRRCGGCPYAETCRELDAWADRHC